MKPPRRIKNPPLGHAERPVFSPRLISGLPTLTPRLMPRSLYGMKVLTFPTDRRKLQMLLPGHPSSLRPCRWNTAACSL